MMEAKDIEVMLCHILGDEKDISKITVWNPESANMCNVASSPTSAKIEYLSQQKPDLQVFLKGCLEGTMADTLNKTLKLFDRETFFYANVLPVYSQFLTKNLEKKNMFLEFEGKRQMLSIWSFKILNLEITQLLEEGTSIILM